MVPIDPADQDPESWRGQTLRDEVRTGSEVRSVLQRATETSLPYQYETEEVLQGAHVEEMFRTRQYTRVRTTYDCGVQSNGRIKLLTHGHFWGGDDDHQRFQAQYRRSPQPTESVPFDTYEVWTRYRFGTVERKADGSIQFVPDPERDGESLRSLDWEELFPPVQRRLVELELVRNPGFARYRLLERGEWDEIRTSLRYDPDVFDIGP